MNKQVLQNLNGLLEEKFQLSSYCDYLKNGESKISDLIGALTTVVDNFDPEVEVEVVSPLTENQILNIFQQYQDLDMNTCITLNKGFTSIGDIVDNLNNGMADYMNGTKTSLEEIKVALYDASGSVVEESVTLNEVVDDLKDSLASSAMQRAAIEASEEENIADKLSKFEVLASQTVDTNNSSFKSACSYYKSLLIEKLPGKEIISRVFNLSGVSDLAEEEPVVLADYPISEYTGASPLGSLSLNCVSNIASAVGKVVGATAAAIGVGLGKIGSWVFGKVRKFTSEIFTNPYDITDNGNNNAAYCFDGFQYQHHYENETSNWLYLTDLSNVSVVDLNNLLASKANTWYTLKTIGGEFAVRWSSFTYEYDSLEQEFCPHFTGDFIFKPYSLSECVPYSESGYTIEEFYNLINTYTGDRYLNTNSTEVDLANSFLNGATVAAQILFNYMLGFNGMSERRIYPSDFTHYSNTVTNSDVFKIATGYWDDNGTARYDHTPIAINVGVLNRQRTGDISWMMLSFITLIGAHYVHNELLNDDDSLSVYTPFCHGTQGMSTGRFGIKTDSTNQALATALAAALIVIVTVTIVLVTGVVIAKKLAKRAFWKRTEFIGRCDNAMWSGQSLSARDRRKYIRYSRKLNASSMLTKGISAAEVASDITGSSPIQDIYQNIVGSSSESSSASLNELRSLIR